MPRHKRVDYGCNEEASTWKLTGEQFCYDCLWGKQAYSLQSLRVDHANPRLRTEPYHVLHCQTQHSQEKISCFNFPRTSGRWAIPSCAPVGLGRGDPDFQTVGLVKVFQTGLQARQCAFLGALKTVKNMAVPITLTVLPRDGFPDRLRVQPERGLLANMCFKQTRRWPSS